RIDSKEKGLCRQSATPAFGESASKSHVATSSASRHSQEPPGTRARLPIHAHAVDPYAVNADRVGREAGVAARKVVDAALRPPVHRGRIEKQQVRVETRLEGAAAQDAEERRRMAREAPHRPLEGEYAEA